MRSEAEFRLEPDVLVGSYRIEKEIGCGGMGTVYEARHLLLPRRAAIKVMHAELRKCPGMATRLVQEASILEDIRHRAIVRVFDCGLLPDYRPWLAMELVDGVTLAARLAFRKSLQPIEVSLLLAEMGDVLATVHAHGVVHRDLKPANLILSNDRGVPLRVIDWGIAYLGSLGRITMDGQTAGTPIYMSPEQTGGRDIAPPCDIYSLGVIAYEALSGRRPFDGRNLAEVVAMHLGGSAPRLHDLCNAPVALCDLIHHMIDRDPALRPRASALFDTARSIADQLPAFDGRSMSQSGSRAEPVVYDRGMLDPSIVVDPDELEAGATGPMKPAASRSERRLAVTPAGRSAYAGR